MTHKLLRCLAISGSLRAASANTTVLRAAALLAPAQLEVVQYTGLGQLPHFNPDLDVDPAPESVAQLRRELQHSQALIICSPEYAHGVPGSLKNALDWLVSGVELSNMAVALINTSPNATHAQASLAETLRTMGARVIPEACVSLPYTARKLSETEMVADAEVSELLRRALAALLNYIR
jgi:chromate reductase, NAD(P)H dehydrogenase (quinone)